MVNLSSRMISAHQGKHRMHRDKDGAVAFKSHSDLSPQRTQRPETKRVSGSWIRTLLPCPLCPLWFPLPLLLGQGEQRCREMLVEDDLDDATCHGHWADGHLFLLPNQDAVDTSPIGEPRSEERRVGKE